MPQLPLRFALLSCLFALLFLPQSALLSADAKGDTAVSLKGKSFEFTYPTEKGKPKDNIKFDDKVMVIGGMSKLKIPYVATTKKGGITSFEGTITDEKLGVIEVSGKIIKGAIQGSITVRPKEGEPYAKNFNSAAQ
jgi:hypothetical protein